jgi:hypothetical protein
MRRLSQVLLLVPVLLGACSGELRGPAAPLAREQLLADPGLEAAIVRSTAERFLRAYAAASRDGARELRSLVTGPKLLAWVHWLAVQNREFDGSISGRPDIRRSTFVQELQAGGSNGAEVDLDASVRFTFDPADGPTFPRTRSFTGPMVLLQTGPVDWKVFDATRDGDRMADGIELFRRDVIDDGGVTVRLDSVFLFGSSWQFNVVVTNGTGSEVRLDPAGAALFVQTGPNAFARVEGATTGSLAVVSAHARIEGLMAYPAQDSAEGRVLSIVYRPGSGPGSKPLRFAFPLEGLITAPSPAPTTSGPVVASPS